MMFFIFFTLGIVAGSMITIQSVLNAALGEKTGYLGSVFIIALVTVSAVILLIALFPSTANLKRIPDLSEWYLYLGGVLAVVIVATPIFLIPRIGATSTLTALVMGQLVLALLIDHFGFFHFPKIEISVPRILGIVLLVLGAYFIRH